MKKMNLALWFKECISYVKSHFWVPLVLSYGAVVLLMALFFQYYLKHEYLDNLLKEAYRTDQSLLSVTQSSLNITLPAIVETGSEMAINPMLYYYVNLPKDAGAEYYVSTELSTLASRSDTIQDLAIADGNGLLYQYSRQHSALYSGIWNEENEAILRNLHQTVLNKIKGTTIRYEVLPMPDSSSTNIVHMAFPVIGNQSRMEAVDKVLVISFRLDVLDDILKLENINKNYFSTGYITNSNDEIIYHDNPSLIGIKAGSYLYDDELSAITSSLKSFGWNINIAVDERAIRQYVDQLYNEAWVVYMLIFSAGLLLLVFIIRQSIRPVAKISAAIRTVRGGELNQKIQIDGENEIWRLAGQYNKMIDSLKLQQQRTAEENRQKVISMKRAAQAEREALESQINAHFLCNTLGAIHYGAMEAGNEEISRMIRKLSNILRYTFSKSYEDVTVAQEIAWVEQYLYLQKFRRMDVFDYDIDFPEAYDEWPCCKLFLQPFVENSIIHGFEGRETGGFIRIKGGEEGGRLKIELTDNGGGIPSEKIAVIQGILKGSSEFDLHGVGIGIRNVVTRLRMFYGEKFSVEMASWKNGGTTFIFRLPIPPGMIDQDDEDTLL